MRREGGSFLGRLWSGTWHDCFAVLRIRCQVSLILSLRKKFDIVFRDTAFSSYGSVITEMDRTWRSSTFIMFDFMANRVLPRRYLTFNCSNRIGAMFSRRSDERGRLSFAHHGISTSMCNMWPSYNVRPFAAVAKRYPATYIYYSGNL